MFSFPVVTGATDGIGKSYAEEVRVPLLYLFPSLHGRHSDSSQEMGFSLRPWEGGQLKDYSWKRAPSVYTPTNTS